LTPSDRGMSPPPWSLGLDQVQPPVLDVDAGILTQCSTQVLAAPTKQTSAAALDPFGDLNERAEGKDTCVTRPSRTHAAVSSDAAGPRPSCGRLSRTQVGSWDISKLLGPAKWTYYYLYVMVWSNSA
jgi:hypothetical protein